MLEMYFQHLKHLSKHAGILLLAVKVAFKHAGNGLQRLKRLFKRAGILLLFVKVASKYAGNILLLIRMNIKSERNVFYQIIHISTLLLHLHFFSNKDSLLFAPPINPLSVPTNPPENT